MGTIRPLVKHRMTVLVLIANSQEIPVSMENVCPEGTENQYVTSLSGEALGRNVDAISQRN